MALTPTQAMERMATMKEPTYIFRDIGHDKESWAVFLMDGPTGERFDLRSACAPYLDHAMKWFYDNSMPMRGVRIAVETQQQK
ncbi:MAG: hypothetical protein KJZ90_03400 [Rhodocyclaceae bacterium]|nr:hypothetical protein [Rhodocyclaceae bacterium]